MLYYKLDLAKLFVILQVSKGFGFKSFFRRVLKRFNNSDIRQTSCAVKFKMADPSASQDFASSFIDFFPKIILFGDSLTQVFTCKHS